MSADYVARIRWTRPALEDLREALDYLASHDADAAARIARMIEASVGRLRDHPELGRIGRVSGTREIVVSRTSYVVAYRLQDEEAQVLAVRHGARRWPDRFENEP